MVQKVDKLFHKSLNYSKNQMLNINFEKSSNWFEEKEKIAKSLLELLFDCGAIKTWYRNKKEGWRLHSGLWSPIYISLREISSKKNSAQLLEMIGISLTKLIINEISNYNKILGLATAGIQIATAISIYSNIPSLYTRKIENDNNLESFENIIKRYGQHNLIEGDLEDNDNIIIVDDLVTKFDSVINGRKYLFYEAKKRNIQVNCKEVAVIIDREQGANEIAKKEKINLHSLIPFKSKLYLIQDKLYSDEYAIIKEYFNDDKKFQDPSVIKDVISLKK